MSNTNWLDMPKYAVGDRVRFVAADWHEADPAHNPPAGTIGVVEYVCSNAVLVQWPKGSRAYDGPQWVVMDFIIEPAK